jgi:hypothetical protein
MADDTAPDLVGSERDLLLNYLNKNRDAVVRDMSVRPTSCASRSTA